MVRGLSIGLEDVVSPVPDVLSLSDLSLSDIVSRLASLQISVIGNDCSVQVRTISR